MDDTRPGVTGRVPLQQLVGKRPTLCPAWPCVTDPIAGSVTVRIKSWSLVVVAEANNPYGKSHGQ